MACKIIKETEIPGAVLPSEFDETGTVTMTLRVDSAMWEGDTYVSGTTTYRHMPELDTELASVWVLVGSDLLKYLTAKPE